MTIAIHALECLACVFLYVAPVPLCIWLAARNEVAAWPRTPEARWMTVFVLWLGLQTGVALVLGLLHAFSLEFFLAAELAAFVAGVALLRRHGVPDFARGAGAAMGGAELPQRLPLAAVAIVGVTLVWWTAAVPIQDWDSWAYHLPSMVQWLQAHSFTRQDQFLHSIKSAFPYGWEAMCAVFIAPFREDFLVSFPNVIAWILLGLGVHALAVELGAERVHALACATLLMVMPTFVTHVNSMHVDLPFAALFTAAAYFAVRYGRGSGDGDLALLLMTCGLLSGVRTTGPFYVPLLAGLALLPRALRRRPGESARKHRAGLLWSAASVGSFLFLGGFWYARNWIDYGNPFGEMRISIGGTVLFEGMPVRALATSLAAGFDPFRLEVWRELMQRARGELGLPSFVLFLLVLAWPVGLILRRRRFSAANAATLASLVLGTLVLFWVTPRSAVSGIQLRLGFPFVSMLAVTAAAGATIWRTRAEALGVACVVSAALVIAQSAILWLAVCALVLWGLVARSTPTRRQGGAVRAAMIAVFVVAAVAGAYLARERRQEKRLEFYGRHYEYLEREDPAAIGHLFSGRSYLLYDSKLTRRVIHVPLLEGDSVAKWYEGVRGGQIEIVAVGQDDDREEIRSALAKLERPRGPLAPILSEHFRLYRVDPTWKPPAGE